MTDPGHPLRPDRLTVYGVDTCEDTTRARAHLDALRLAYVYVNLDHEPGVRSVLAADGYRATPVVATPGGRVIVEPTNAELDRILATMSGESDVRAPGG